MSLRHLRPGVAKKSDLDGGDLANSDSKTKHSTIQQIKKPTLDEIPTKIIPDMETLQDEIVQSGRQQRIVDGKKRRSFKLFNVQKVSPTKSKETKRDRTKGGKPKEIHETSQKNTLNTSQPNEDDFSKEIKRIIPKRGNFDVSPIKTGKGGVKDITPPKMKRGGKVADKMSISDDEKREISKVGSPEESDIVKKKVDSSLKADISLENERPHGKLRRSLGRRNKLAPIESAGKENDEAIATEIKSITQKMPNDDVSEQADNCDLNKDNSDATVSRSKRIREKVNYKEIHNGMNVDDDDDITSMEYSYYRNIQNNSNQLENSSHGVSSNTLEVDSDISDNESDSDIFECGVCNEEFKSKEQLMAHLETHDGVQFMLLHEVDEEEDEVLLKYECPHCPLPFETAEDLAHHIKDHFKKEKTDEVVDKDYGRRREFACKLCEKKFEKNFSLQNHIQTVHYGIKRFVCKLCDKRFTLSGTLKKHMYIHGKIRPYKCKECNYSCNQRGTLVRHVQRKHLKEKRFGCEICGKLFVTKYEVFQHHKKGHNEDKLHCTLCTFKCNDVDVLKNHLRIHNETPYKCNLCSRKFSDHEFYLDHVRTHKGQKGYKCSFCPWTGNHNTAFSYHLKREHPNEMPYPCTKCNEKFDTNAKLKRHMLYHTADQIYMCEKCDFITKTWSQLKEHYFGKEIDNILNKCRICEETFRSLVEVQEHMNDHCIRKRLRNAPAASTNTQKDWFKCYYCYKKFRSKISLSIHLKTHSEAERRRIKQELRLEDDEEEDEEVPQKEVITCDAAIQFDDEELDTIKNEQSEDGRLFNSITEYIIDDSHGNIDGGLMNREIQQPSYVTEIQQPSYVTTSRVISAEELMSMESSQYQIVYDEIEDSENATGVIRELLDDWE